MASMIGHSHFMFFALYELKELRASKTFLTAVFGTWLQQPWQTQNDIKVDRDFWHRNQYSRCEKVAF